MIVRSSQPPQPILAITPSSLDFGLVSVNGEPSEGHGVAKLTIRNDGERTLVGRIAIQVSWVSVYPPDFRLNPGESAEHLFTVRRINQLTPNTGHKLGSEFIALINSNGGSETIGGHYYIDTAGSAKKRKSPLSFSPRLFAAIGAALLLTAAILFFIFFQDRAVIETNATDQVSALYTQLAETIHADLALNQPAETSLPSLPTAPLSAPAPLAGMGVNPTFTPWPANEYPNPETFVRSYYESLAARDFLSAWWMLTEKVQIACCYNKGVNPADYFATVWGAYSDIQVSYAYLQTTDQNPAIINVGITYKDEDGEDQEAAYTVEVVTSSSPGSLLIDEIR